MDVEVLLHGVPQGQDFFGVKEEREQLETFYAKSNESVKLVVDVKKRGTTSYVYYNYLRYNSILGAGGRTGSYLGITLRIDELYLDVRHMYNMLDIAFNKYVVGSILTKNEDTYKYLSAEFASKKAEIERLQQGIMQLIQTTCVASKFTKIDNSMVKSISSSPECHVDEVSEGVLLATIKKYSRIVLSTEFKSQKEKDLEKKLNDVDARISSAVTERDKQIAEKNSTINTLNSTLATRDARITALEKENRNYKNTGDVSRHIEKVKEPINALAEYFRVKDMDSTRHAPKFGHKNFYIGIVNVCLLIFVSVITVLCLMNTAEATEETVSATEHTKLHAKYTALEKKCQRLESMNAEIFAQLPEAKRTELQKQFDTEDNQGENQDDNGNKSDSIKITVTPNVGKVKAGQKYTFSVGGYDGKGKWGADGFKLTTDANKLTVEATVKPINPGDTATISFKPEGGEKVKLQFICQ